MLICPIFQFYLIAWIRVNAGAGINTVKLEADLLPIHAKHNEVVGAEGSVGSGLHQVLKLDLHSPIGIQVSVQIGFSHITIGGSASAAGHDAIHPMAAGVVRVVLHPMFI